RESLMQHMIEVWWSLENITTVLSDMTSLLAQDPEKQAMRTMLMQHQLALDTLFAFEGGLCAKFVRTAKKTLSFDSHVIVLFEIAISVQKR
uniref:Uncharacterized protein n=1 Tax=Nothobranchius furzeri TaxID=105023 RepID=A0A8C6NH45_NOTFU